MDVTIHPAPLHGTIPAIASKSMAHRLLIMAALCPGTTDINCNATSKDIQATVSCLEALGARIASTRLGFRVNPLPGTSATDNIRQAIPGAHLDCGESGSTLRFMLPIVAALGRGGSLDGHGRLADRPLSPLYEELVCHGVTLSTRGKLPLEVSGTLLPGRFSIPGNVSSQFVSGLLMAAPLLSAPSEIVVTEPVESRSYIRLTIRALAEFGIDVGVTHETVDGNRATVLSVSPARSAVSPGTVTVEGDWSNAAFWLAAGAIAGGVSVSGLDLASAQGDRTILACAAAFGARVSRSGNVASTTPDTLRGRTIDVRDTPDLVPPLAAIAANASGTTVIANAGRLRLKESDRLSTVNKALTAMGASIEEEPDALVIHGNGSLSGGTVDAANDHRIAMMAAIAGANAIGPTTIRGAECVAKSYPRFFEDFRTLGGIAEEG
ncbi:3-phosphoshikimate 1-carboxyvinyltransferase [Tractidigestivibacter scatoligenes]|uniref:3-phosphoshikimate 1-carboxyvinyltransferase n=1 Tax=Tractidigestivibacter scatoligenes TaxID=1299998 RepID=A0A100YW09_TRASO|nr:3-phosphoshikimate 1-carboxyvinyltransferase [Tractidigestivibacter scatoligenes]KUH58457.1 3-phosphoshikimate 1-carboxyvinyltransferase [Tractidigestivibacter scatoligenes]